MDGRCLCAGHDVSLAGGSRAKVTTSLSTTPSCDKWQTLSDYVPGVSEKPRRTFLKVIFWGSLVPQILYEKGFCGQIKSAPSLPFLEKPQDTLVRNPTQRQACVGPYFPNLSDHVGNTFEHPSILWATLTKAILSCASFLSCPWTVFWGERRRQVGSTPTMQIGPCLSEKGTPIRERPV